MIIPNCSHGLCRNTQVGVSFVKDAEDVLKVREYIEDYFFEKLKKELVARLYGLLKRRILSKLALSPDIHRVNDAINQKVKGNHVMPFRLEKFAHIACPDYLWFVPGNMFQRHLH